MFYSFAMVVYEIITNLKPYQGGNIYGLIMDIVQKGTRPEFTEQIPDCYIKLIEKCWSQDPKDRPTFDEIVHLLKTDRDFIRNNINEDDYRNYIEYIDKEQSSFCYTQQINQVNSDSILRFHRINIFFI